MPLKDGVKVAAPAADSPHPNHLLDALSTSDYERLAHHLELIRMRLGDVLHESGDQLRYVYSPTTCILSLLYVMEDGAAAEIAIVGNEGIVGISLFMGGNTTPSGAIVQGAGYAYRLKAALRKNAFERYGWCECCLARNQTVALHHVRHRTDRRKMVAHTAFVALDHGGRNGRH